MRLRPSSAAPDNAALRVLYVDDEPDLVRLVELTLTRHGIPVVGTTSPAAAIRAARRDFFAVVITDLRMPGMDGLALIEHIQAISPDSVFIIVTALPDIDLRRGPQDRAIVSIVAKPWEREQFVKRVENAAALYRERLAFSSDASRYRVLLLEDDPDDVERLQRACRRASGFETISCSRLSAATELLRTEQVDIVVADLSLPDARGLDAIIHLQRVAPNAALVVCSGNVDEAVAIQSLRLGAQDIISKEQPLAELPMVLEYALARKHALRRLRHLADYDSLTGLLNRSSFRARATAALGRKHRSGGALAIGVADLDGFKPVNDEEGHESGDVVLQIVASRFQGALAEGDIVARLGGDEFGFLFESFQTLDELDSLVDVIGRSLNAPARTPNGGTHRISASIGVAVHGSGGSTIDELIRVADKAMYEAKSAGGGYRRVGSEELPSTLDIDQARVFELRRAVEAGDGIYLMYQPQVELRTGRIVAFEGLARWKRADGTQCPPNVFVPLLEQSGLIHEVGAHMLELACARLARWRRGEPVLRIAVNVSAHQMMDRNFANMVARCLETHDVPPKHLELEITERVLMGDKPELLESLSALESLGVRLAIDDFGTGYASLHYLQRFRVDAIKIDQSFVGSMCGGENPEVSVPGAISALGARIGASVIAEGVETAQQHEMLMRVGCGFGQGYYFGHPTETTRFDVPELR